MSTMATSATTMTSFHFTKISSSFLTKNFKSRVNFSNFSAPKSLKLSSSHSICSFPTTAPIKACTILPRSRKFTIEAHKGYKMKTHKASAKRFRVTGRGKIVRRCAGKQHLLVKKNTKRKLRLSKTVQVSRSDYDNVIGALPYLKVKRNAT